MIIKINGAPIVDYKLPTQDFHSNHEMCYKDSWKYHLVAVPVWVTSGVIAAEVANAASTGLWESGKGLFSVFQELAMFGGGIAAMVGLISLFIKKRFGTNVLYITAIVVGGAFLVPSAIMLVAIIGTGVNDALEVAFAKIRAGH